MITQFLITQACTARVKSNTSDMKPQKVDAVTYAAFKQVNYKSQLIRLKTLPTLIRLCCTYSLNYRIESMSASPFNSTKNTASFGKELNIFLLIESISTLTYLIELSPELQVTASYLEQIIPILSRNVLSACSMISLSERIDQVSVIKS